MCLSKGTGSRFDRFALRQVQRADICRSRVDHELFRFAAWKAGSRSTQASFENWLYSEPAVD
jgi:hypothetical protein